jgi:muramoyltetrapeptide carboxypeptidase
MNIDGYKVSENLKVGDTICLISTARKVSMEEITFSINEFEDWGLKVELGKHLFQIEHQFAGSDAQRAEDLQTAINDNNIKAIICVRGGYGTTKMLDLVDFLPLLSNPKWIVGFSDVTALLCHLEKLKIVSIHAIMPILFSKPEANPSVKSLRDVLFTGNQFIACKPNSNNKLGTANGILVGGNLSLIVHLIGTNSEIETDNKILFLEDLDEYLYHIDRMFVQLKRAGKLARLQGLIIGHFSDLKDNVTPFGKSVEQIILEAAKDYEFPVCFGFPVGHSFDNLPLICGKIAFLEINKKGVYLKQS